MIENIRKYTGLLIVFFALVVVALVVGIKDDIFRGGTSGQPVLKIAGRTYNDKEFHQYGSGSLELAQFLARSGDFGLYSFVLGLTSGAASQDEATERFFINRMIVRQAQDELGVNPGKQEVEDYIRSMRAFAGPDGKFSEETYRMFIDRGIGRLGMTEKDLRELAVDALASQKINSIVGSGLGQNRDITATRIAMDDQRVSGHIARLAIDSYEAAIQPTDEEIKEYWETIQDAFMTEPRRKFTYVIATPEIPQEPAAEEEKPETETTEAVSDEDKAAADVKKAEAKAKKDAELAEARRKKQLELDAKVDDFAFQLEEQQGAGFEELAKETGFEPVATELFTRSAPPAALDVNLRSSSLGGKAIDELFRIVATTDPVSKISQPIAIGENQWLVARLDEEEPSRPKTFEEAKDEARDRYINEKATEAMRAAAEKAAEKIKEGLAAGQSFADAAKEAGIENTSEFNKVTASYRPDPATEPRNLFDSTRYVDPGALAEIVVEADRSFVIHVASREVDKNPEAANRIDGGMTQAANANETNAFIGWLAERADAADVQRLSRR